MELHPDKIGVVTLGTHFFSVVYKEASFGGILLRFVAKYIVYKIQSDEIADVFGARNTKHNEYRFHICQYPEFLMFLEKHHIDVNRLDVVHKPMYEPKPMTVKVREQFVLREQQVSCVNFLLAEEEGDLHSRMTTAPTGTGKSVMSLVVASKRGFRTALLVLPTYQEKWALDITKHLEVDPKRIMIISGSKNLKAAMAAGLDDELDVDFLIISLSTVQSYIKEFQFGDDEKYDNHPEDMFQCLGVGTVISDETHQHLFGVYRAMLYMHVPKLVALSATFIDDDRFVADMQHKMFPKEIRFSDFVLEKYTNVYAVSYNFTHKHKYQVRTTEYGSNMYSHSAFEKSIMKNPNMKQNYFSLIKECIDAGYNDIRKEGDKLLVFVQSIKMATQLVDYAKFHYHGMKINRYVEDDPFENLMESDICVSTIGSAGTAVDIPNLRTVIMTTAIKSSKSNIQALGRLRKLPDRDTRFMYLYSEDIPKHREYHDKKKELFKDRVASIKEVRSSVIV